MMRQWIDLIESLQAKPSAVFSQHQFLQNIANFIRKPVTWSWLKDNTWFKTVNNTVELHFKHGEFDPIVFSHSSLCVLGLDSLEQLQTLFKQHGIKKRVNKKHKHWLYFQNH